MDSGDKCDRLIDNKHKRTNPSHVLNTLVNLLKNSISCKLYERQELLLADLITSSSSGFYLHDLYNFNQLMQEFIEKWDENPTFPKYLKRLIKICKFSPLLCRSNEILYSSRDLTEYFSTLGYLLVLIKDNEIKLEILSSIGKLLEEKRYKPEHHSVILPTICEALGCSEFPSLLANLLEISEGSLYQEVMELSVLILEKSDDGSISMLQEGALITILTRLEPNWEKNTLKPNYLNEFNDLNVERTNVTLKLTELLLKALETKPKELTKDLKSPSIECYWGLRYVLQNYVVNNLHLERNYCMSLILKLLQLFPGTAVAQTGIVEDICILCGATEFGTGGTWAATSRNIGKGSENYFDFKRLLILSIPWCLENFGATGIIKEKNIIPSFLRILSEHYHHSWLPEELQTLRCTTLLVLERIMEKVIDDFINNDGLKRLVKIAKHYIFEEFSTLDLLILCLNCIFSCVRILSVEQLKKICNKDWPKPQLREISKRHIERSTYLSCSNQKAEMIIINILTRLICIENDHQIPQEVEMSTRFFKRFLNPRLNDSKYTPDLVVATLNHLWELGKVKDEYFQKFVQLKGVYLLLDLIKESSFPVKLVGLGLLVDMCEEGSCLPYLLTWRNKNSCFLSLLLSIFAEENAMIGVTITSRGVIDDLDNPIAGVLQKQNKSKDNLLNSSPCITDMEGSSRPKIYAITQLIKNDEIKITVANEYYKIYGFNLTTDEKICKILCDNYLVLKIGEMWKELEQIFVELHVDVVPFDRYLLDTIVMYYQNTAENLQKLQNEWIVLENRNERISELEFYNLIRNSKLGSALKAVDEINFIAKITDATFRTNTRNSIKSPNEEITEPEHRHTHRTTTNILKSMNVVSQKFLITSDFVIDAYSEISPIPVSPCTSDDNPILKGERFTKNSQISLNLSVDIDKQC